MNIVLWVIAGLLAFAFGAAGLVKLTTPAVKLHDKMAWTREASETKVKAIGAAEVLGAVGLILPGALHIAPVLTPVAALCLAVLMAGGAWTHLRAGEGWKSALPAIVLGVLSLVVAVARFGPYAF